MNLLAAIPSDLSELVQTRSGLARAWKAQIDLSFEQRQAKTAMVRALHQGPLRVQRPFYPEADGCCHVYLLHPPGGIAIGDKLNISAEVKSGSALITTPSAGRIYGTGGLVEDRTIAQIQQCDLNVNAGASLEWLPQETILFNGAQAKLSTRVDLNGDAGFYGWDIIRLGRPASGELFESGCCHQSIELYRDGIPLFIEQNRIFAGDSFCDSKAGMQSKTTMAAALATMVIAEDTIDTLQASLDEDYKRYDQSAHWALTQKATVFIARYLGNSIIDCRAGLEFIWQQTRLNFKQCEAVYPRIWNT